MYMNVDANSLQYVFEREPTKTTEKPHTAVVWGNISAPITCGTDRVGVLCRRLIEFLTHGSFEKYLPETLTVEWYYGDTGLDHNDQDI